MFPELLVVATLVIAGPVDAQLQSQARDEDLRWSISLQEKAALIQRDISARHLVEGTYVPCVPIPANGQPVDHTTTGNTGDMHASSWTGCYLVAAAFRYGWAKERGTPEDVQAALDLGGQLVHGIDVLTHITGKPGLLVRKVVHGHGPAVEERTGSNARNEWHQGVGEYSALRYRGHPSHHNYHHVLRGLAIWYYFLQMDNPYPSPVEKAQMDKVRSIVGEMMEYGYKANDLTLMTVDGRVSTRLVYGVTEGQPSTRAVMATNCLKFAHWITGDPWYKRKYDELVEQFGYKPTGNWPADQWQGRPGRMHAPDHDDTEHTLVSLWLVYRLEEDPDLKDFYRMAVASIFETKKYQKRSPFNYYYASVTGDLEGADLPGALETLRLYPSVTLTYPFMNSIRTDIAFSERGGRGRRGAEPVLSFNEQPLDNAYDWKGDPFILDRWMARQVTSLAVSDEDPMVWYLSDATGTLYQSLDGGETFTVSDFHQNACVRDITFAGNKNRIALAATNRGIFRTDRGGYMNAWQHVQVGPEGNGASRLMVDSSNPYVVWAVMGDGVYRSVDLGLEQIGKAWEPISGPMPSQERIVYGLTTGMAPIVYAAIGGRVYRRSLNDSAWAMSPVDMEDYHVIPTYRQIVVSPDDPETAFMLLTLNIWRRDWPLVLRAQDGGETIEIVGWQLPRPYPPSRGSGLESTEVTALTIDPYNPEIIYGASPKGVYRSTDSGMTWGQCNSGLRIPYAYEVFAPKQTPDKIFVSTPAGLHISSDKGQTWSSPILVLNGPGINRVERGGLGYLAAYWPGRYFGYVTDEQAAAGRF